MIEDTLQELGKQQMSGEDSSLILASRKGFNEIAYLANQLCGTEVAILNIYEDEGTQIHSINGLTESEIPFSGRLSTIPDNFRILYKEDFDSGIFINSPDLGMYSFYAGLPLIAGGEILGILYVLDYEERILTPEQQTGITILGNQVIRLLDYRQQHTELKHMQLKLRQKYKDLEKFASVVSHDIKSPLANIISLTEFLKEENREAYSEETKQYLDFLTQSSYSLRNYVDGILTFYRSDNILEREKEDVDLNKMLQGIANLYTVNSDVLITFPSSGVLKNVNKAALTQIFMNLISNALKYNSKAKREVYITFQEESEFYLFDVRDNGNGIPKKDFDRIFDLFTTLDVNDRDGHPGSGIGLATVKIMLDHMQGSIDLESVMDIGSNFKFRIRKK